MLLMALCLPSLLLCQAMCLHFLSSFGRMAMPAQRGEQRRKGECLTVSKSSLVTQLLQHMTGGKEKGENCRTCITGIAKPGPCARFKRAPINRVDRWSPVIPHPHVNPFSILVCHSLPHSQPPPEPSSCCTPNRVFVAWQTVPFTGGFSGRSIISSPYLFLIPFHLLFVFHSYPENSPPLSNHLHVL